jgi:hypothetical protein
MQRKHYLALPCRSAGRLPARAAALAFLAAAAMLMFPAPGQGQAGAGTEEPIDAGLCRQGRISEIWVDNHSVFDLTDPNRSRRFEWAFRLANRLHIPTREDVIRRELVFREGDCYDPALLRESERVLRATGYIAEVDIYGIEQPDHSYHVVVDTRDEWSTRIQPQTGPGTGLQLTGIALREDNLLGTGRKATAFYLRSYDSRIYGASYLDPQIFGTRWQAGIAAGRTPTGSFFRETVEYPFVGEAGRFAFRHNFLHHDRYFHYLLEQNGELAEVLMPERRRTFDIGAARRFGPRGRSTLFGAMIVGDWVSYPSAPRVTGDAALVLASPGDSLVFPITSRVETEAEVRVLALFGQRNVYFIRRRALDTVHGVEDVRLGVELELGLGPNLTGFSSGNNLSVNLGLFAAEQVGQRILTGTRLAVEGKRNYDAPADSPEWDDVFGQVDVWAYWQLGREARHTLVGLASGSGGWNPRVPFQLTLGGATGLRGHPFHLAPGAHRVVLTLEERSYLGWPHPELFDLGSTVFVDFGRIWAGDAPYGVDSRLFTNVGLGLRGAFPPGSHNTFRVDVAAPIGGRIGFSDLVFSVGVGQTIGRSGRPDHELARSFRRGSSTSLFSVRSDRE